MDEWGSLSDLINESNRIRHVDVYWLGKKLRVYFKFLTEGDDVSAQAEVIAAKDEKGKAEALVRYNYELVYLMIAKANGEMTGQNISREDWESLPKLLRDRMAHLVLLASDEVTSGFLSGPTNQLTPS